MYFFVVKFIISNALSCAFLFWRVLFNWTHLALAAQSPEKLVALEFGLLVRYDARHLENEPGRPRLFVQTHPVER